MSHLQTNLVSDGTGLQIPVESFTGGVTEMFPLINKPRLIETSIASRHRLDILPTNATLNEEITDKYIEFNIPGQQGAFLDLSSLMLELKLHLIKGDAKENIGDDEPIVLVNNALHSLFKSATVFVQGQQIENNPLYPYTSFVRMLTGMSISKRETLARNMFFYDDNKGSGIQKDYTQEYFLNLNRLEKKVTKEVKNQGVHLCAPLLLDLATSDGYLLDNVDVRIRLEFSSTEFVLSTSDENMKPKFVVDLAKLHITRLRPHPQAMLALNASLQKPGNSVDYLYTKSLYKTYIMSLGQQTFSIDLPWQSVIPEKLYFFMCDMDAFAGSFKKNPFYFDHNSIRKIHLTVNGASVYNINVDFPYHFSSAYYHVLNSIGIEKDHVVTRDSFSTGRTLFVLDLQAEKLADSIALEQSGNLRIDLEFEQPMNANKVLVLLGDTQGRLSINSDRRIYSDIRA